MMNSDESKLIIVSLEGCHGMSFVCAIVFVCVCACAISALTDVFVVNAGSY